MLNTRTVLTPKAKKLILGKNMRMCIALYNRLSIITQESLRRWCRDNDIHLTHPDIIAIICAYENCEPSELTELVTLEMAEV